mmetsp:Transcript_6079/g.12424  ORF Transcript_6079/g.12424 Transcript_6079/m.12424 type:complete len:236 (+) Transcript_6079:3-710(+)
MRTRPDSYRGVKCTLYMSEQQYSEHSNITYMIKRNPRHHVLSQYFHCTESSDHARRAHEMPSLDDWLEYWSYNSLDGEPTNVTFGCYDPRNMQSKFADFHPERGDSIAGIQKKFAVIAPMDDLDVAICVIFVHYTGWIPEACDCSLSQTVKLALDQEKSIAKESRNESVNFDHGVKNHGATYNTTKSQDELINQLIERDMLLYEYSKEIFEQQLMRVEEFFNVTICQKIKQQPQK